MTRARPGHADLAGVQKYGLPDVRDALERASARHTAVHVAAGAVAKALLAQLDISVRGEAVREAGADPEAVDAARKDEPPAPLFLANPELVWAADPHVTIEVTFTEGGAGTRVDYGLDRAGAPANPHPDSAAGGTDVHVGAGARYDQGIHRSAR